MKFKFFMLMMSLFLCLELKASSEGISPKTLANYEIAGLSRPCCSFGLDKLGTKFGLAGPMDPSKLGEHHFARDQKKKDNVGIVYTCSAGFVDVSHLRDNADWSAHIFFNLPIWLGSNQEIVARSEGGFKDRTVYFPKLEAADFNSLTEDDLEKIAISIGYSVALLHEIATSFNIAVSAPASLLAFEKSSAFSIEDAYSNLLGNYLGVKAARDTLPFNQAMTLHLNSTLKYLGVQPLENTLEAYEMVRNDWWIQSWTSSFKDIRRRNFAYQGEVRPFQVHDTKFCQKISPQTVTVPSLLSNGKSVNDYYEVRARLSFKLKFALKRLGFKHTGMITQKDFPQIIEAIRLRFISKLGPKIEQY